MKKSLFATMLAMAALLSSCVSVKEIGHVNVLSTRNTELGSVKYSRIATYAGESKQELKKSRAVTIDEAINNTIRQYPGGEFMTNVKIWLITQGKNNFFAVSGDIYGKEDENGFVERSHRGFAVGDAVIWQEAGGNFVKGVIESHVDNETCVIRREDGKLVKQKYTKLSK
ncbi:MAG: hypothetical protein IJT12_09975 [Paludibacteraceae bacterium]|nr:hypothetical protein [Paludibacteraceae bacterium]